MRLQRFLISRHQPLQIGQGRTVSLELDAGRREFAEQHRNIAARLGDTRGVLIEELLARGARNGDIALVPVEERQVNRYSVSVRTNVARVVHPGETQSN